MRITPMTEAVMVRLPADLKVWLQETAEREERSVNMLIRRIIQAERTRQFAQREPVSNGHDH